MHAADKSVVLEAESQPTAQQHTGEAADSKPGHASKSEFWSHHEADMRGSTNILDTQAALPTTYWARELEVDRTDWNMYLRGNLAEEGRFLGLSCSWWSIFCCLKGPSGGKEEEVDVEKAGQKQKEKVRRGIFYMRTLSPSDRLVTVWIFLAGLVDLTYTAFLMPLLIIFPTNNTMYSWASPVNLILGGLVYWIDIFMRFRMGFCVVYNLKRELIMDGGLIAHFYVRHNTFLLDFLAAIPSIAELVWVCSSGDQYYLPLHIILLLRLFRMQRVFYLMKSMMILTLTGQYSRKLFRGLSVGHIFLFSLGYITMWLLNLMGCSWIWLASVEGKQNSWMQVIGTGTNIAEKTPARQWVGATYFAVMLLTTTGLGDTEPATPAEEILASLQMMMGVFVFGLIVSVSQSILSMLSDNARRMGPLRDKLQWVELWMHRRHLSDKLGRRVRAYYTEIWANHKDLHHDSFYDELPAALRAEVTLEITATVFQGSSLLSVLHDRARRALCERLKPYSLPAGHDACQEGDECKTIWLLTEGEIVAIRRERKEEYLTAPDVVGEVAVLSSCLPELATRPCTFQAVAPCTLWTLEVEDLYTVVDLYPNMAPALQKAFDVHLRHQVKRVPGHAWARILEEYEKLPEHERPFSNPADRKHLSDDEDEVRDDVQKPARMGASGEEAKTQYEPKHRKQLTQHSPDDSVRGQNGPRGRVGSSPDDTVMTRGGSHRQISSSADDSVMRQSSLHRQAAGNDYHHYFAGDQAQERDGAADGRGRGTGADADLKSAAEHDAGAHHQPSAEQESTASHQQYDGDRPGADQPHKHAFRKQ